MADVQLEHGYLRFANLLLEAIMAAPFSATQLKIVLCIVRLTYGWRQSNVRMSRPEIAQRCGVAPVGGFLRAFDELLRNRVLLEIEAPFGRHPGAYSINKDFEHWGIYSVPVERLAVLFSQRPNKSARQTPEGDPSIEGGQTLAGQSNETIQTPQGQGDRPSRVGVPDPVGSPKSLEVVDNDEVRPSERHRNTEKDIRATATRARDASDPGVVAAEDREQDYALRLTRAANAAITKRWGEQPTPLHYGGSTQLAHDLLVAGVAIEVAEEAITRTCERKKGEKPGSVEYFRPSILTANQVAEQRQFEHDNPARSSAPTGLTRVDLGAVTRERVTAERTEHELRGEYDRERVIAVAPWIKANATRYAAIVSAANSEWSEFLTNSFGKKARDATIAEKCAAAAGFPDFETWKRDKLARTGASPPSTPENFSS